ncbi:MAG TPA: DUF885 family protein [Fimbriimonadales bacterium]|nr:DUF885 family protein [Fimbriimonadales bacterium]
MQTLLCLAGMAFVSIAPADMTQFIETYSSDWNLLRREYSIAESPERGARLRIFLTERLREAKATKFSDFDDEGRVDAILIRNQIEHEIRQLGIDEKSRKETEALFPFGKPIISFGEDLRAMKSVDPEAAAGVLDALAQEIESARKGVDSGNLTAKGSVANRAARTVDSLKGTLDDWFSFYNGYDPLFTWWVETPYKSASKALENYSALLREKLVGTKKGDEIAIVGDPIGREALLSELQFEMIPYTPEELIQIANKEYAWCEAEMKKASREMGFGDDWKKALEKVKQDHVAPGKQPELVRNLAKEAIRFVEDHQLMTVPELCKETWRRQMMSPRQQLMSPFFLGGETIQIAYPTDQMSQEDKMMSMRGNNVHFARATVFHELIPGHCLQAFMNERYRPYRGIFWTPFWTEGWALYCEMLFWDLGFPKTPENKIGMLFWRMHRCARIIFSLNFHLEKMSPQECVDLLVEKVGHERANAEAEVRRSLSGDYGPLYQCAYMLGGLQFKALHHDLVDSGKMTNREFHDTILKENNIPVAMVRALLTKEKLDPDFRATWRFYPLY